MVAGLGIYWKAYLDRKRELTHKDQCQGNTIEVQDLTKNDTVGISKPEIDSVDAKLDHFEAKLIETMRKDMRNIEEKIIKRLKEH